MLDDQMQVGDENFFALNIPAKASGPESCNTRISAGGKNGASADDDVEDWNAAFAVCTVQRNAVALVRSRPTEVNVLAGTPVSGASTSRRAAARGGAEAISTQPFATSSYSAR